MDSHMWILFLAFILIHVNKSLTIAQPEELLCANTGNYTNNSIYQTNLNTALSSLSSNAENTKNTTSFYNFSVGRKSNQVNALALCRGDVEPENCRTCLNNSSHKLRESCPNQKESIVWYDNCMLRYSNRSISHTVETRPAWFMWNQNNASNVAQFNSVVRASLEKLKGRAAKGGNNMKFATGDMTGPDNTTIYGLVQCTPDLSERQCSDCLNKTFGWLPKCCDGKIGGRVGTPSCNFRYEIYRFYNQTLLGGPPPKKFAPPPADAPTPVDAPPPHISAPPPADAPPPHISAPPPADAPPPHITAPPPADAPPATIPPPQSYAPLLPPSGKGVMNNAALIALSTITTVVTAILVP